jgi:hypothetical protein
MMLASFPFTLFSTTKIHRYRAYLLTFGAAPLKRPRINLVNMVAEKRSKFYAGQFELSRSIFVNKISL